MNALEDNVQDLEAQAPGTSAQGEAPDPVQAGAELVATVATGLAQAAGSVAGAVMGMMTAPLVAAATVAAQADDGADDDVPSSDAGDAADGDSIGGTGGEQEAAWPARLPASVTHAPDAALGAPDDEPPAAGIAAP